MKDHDSLDLRQVADAQPPLALRDALVTAISRRRRHTRYRVAATAATLVAVAAVVLAGGVFRSGPSRVLAIDTNDGSWVSVQVLDGQAGAAEMTSELQGAGINGQVKLLPASPDLVGEWMGVQVVNESQPQCGSTPPPGLSCANAPLLGPGEASMDGDALRISSDALNKLSGKQLFFYLGRAPEGGEQPLDRLPGH